MKKTIILSTLLGLSFSGQAAKYEVIELATPDQFRHAYARDINEQGDMVAAVRGNDLKSYLANIYGVQFNSYVNSSVLYNHPFDITQLNFENAELIAFLGQDSADNIQAGVIDNTSLENIAGFLHSTDLTFNLFNKQLSGYYHQIGEYWGAVSTNDSLSHFPVLDTINANTNQYSFEFNESLTAINDLGWVVGATESPYQDIPYQQKQTDADGVETLVDKTFHVQDYIERAFVKIGGNVTLLDPPFTDFRNGRSIATDVSNSGYVVGHASTGMKVLEDSTLDVKLSNCELNDTESQFEPEEICLWRSRELNFSTSSSAASKTSENLYKTITTTHHAYRWRVNAAGEVLEAKDLGVAFNENADNYFNLYSQATAVNESGIAVGRSHVYLNEAETALTTFATIYKDDEVITIADDYQLYFESIATDINNNDIVVGQANVRKSFGIVNQAFYYDINQPEQGIVFIDSSDESAQTTVNAISDNGFIVGKTQVTSLNGGGIINHGFIYDMNEKTFTDLNNLISCESGVTIVEGEGINEDGEIIATATVAADAKLLDGSTIFNSQGEAIQESNTKVVKLKLIPGGDDSEGCFDEQNKVKRKGASMGYGILAFISGLLFVRRRVIKNNA